MINSAGLCNVRLGVEPGEIQSSDKNEYEAPDANSIATHLFQRCRFVALRSDEKRGTKSVQKITGQDISIYDWGVSTVLLTK
jgi:hypothetical protein